MCERHLHPQQESSASSVSDKWVFHFNKSLLVDIKGLHCQTMAVRYTMPKSVIDVCETLGCIFGI